MRRIPRKPLNGLLKQRSKETFGRNTILLFVTKKEMELEGTIRKRLNGTPKPPKKAKPRHSIDLPYAITKEEVSIKIMGKR